MTYLILGYGVPKRIEDDLNYAVYLRTVFNTIWTDATQSEETPTVVFCGGKTDIKKPYARTEANEMIRAFKALCLRDPVRANARGWRFFAESVSISTPESLLFAKRLLARKRSSARVTVFCEATRSKRVRTLARRIFPKSRVIAVDFDQSANRYLNPAFLVKKERTALAFDLRALASPKALKTHHRLHAERLAKLRAAGSAKHVEAVRAWWEEVMEGNRV